MKKLLTLFALSFFFLNNCNAQLFASCENVTAFDTNSHPDLGIVISSGEPETVWNALRLGIAAQSKGDSVVIFVISKATDVFINDSSQFNISNTSLEFIKKGGAILTCSTCAKLRHTDEIQMCTLTSVFDLYEIIKHSKKTISF